MVAVQTLLCGKSNSMTKIHTSTDCRDHIFIRVRLGTYYIHSGICIKYTSPNSYNFVEVSGHKLESSVDIVYIRNQFQITFAWGGGGPLVEVTVNSKEENF
jgi:hypothetical protein